MPGLRRYDLIARRYDAISPERWLYAGPRARTLALLNAAPGDTVLDLGCGTGLNLPHLVPRVGTTGRVVGVDASAGMLAVAGSASAAARHPPTPHILDTATVPATDTTRARPQPVRA